MWSKNKIKIALTLHNMTQSIKKHLLPNEAQYKYDSPIIHWTNIKNVKCNNQIKRQISKWRFGIHCFWWSHIHTFFILIFLYHYIHMLNNPGLLYIWYWTDSHTKYTIVLYVIILNLKVVFDIFFKNKTAKCIKTMDGRC